jgi:acyl carrier protein
MKTSELLFFIAFGAVTTFIVTMMFRDWLRKRRITTTLARRVPQDAEHFGREFFPDPKRAEIAARVRRVLSNNLKMPLEGLAPSDRLNDDLNAELPANPHLFWELEAEFGIKTDVEDLDSHEKTLERLITFQDLVEYVEGRISEPKPQSPDADEDEQPSRAYDLAIRSIPIVCIGGFLTAVVGIVIQKRALMNLGGLIFISGFAIWGFANGGVALCTLIQSVCGSTWKETLTRPWPLIVLTFLTVFFLWVGGIILWGILKNVSSSK